VDGQPILGERAGANESNACKDDGLQNSASIFLTRCALIRGCRCFACSRRIVRQRDKTSVGARSDVYAIAQTSEALDEEADAYAIAHRFAQTKESVTDSLANLHAEEQIKAEKSDSHTNTRDRRKSILDSIGNASAFNV